MVMESFAIVAIIVCIILVFIRSKNFDYAISITPLLCVPVLHLVAYPILFALRKIFPYMPNLLVLAFVDIAALAITCLCVFLFSLRIRSAKNKKLYIALMMGYSICLVCAYVYQILHPLFA